MAVTRWIAAKRWLLGHPLASAELEAQALPKRLALPTFASDALSSVAYATEETMLVLALAGTIAFQRVQPIAIAIALLLTIVVTSYRQTVRAYPKGGGSFLVSLDNLGLPPAMVAAAAILIDYVLTVAVSVAAGTAAVTSAAPHLVDYRVPIAIGFVLLITAANLRGVRESGTLFAVPTYSFILIVLITLGVGLVRCVHGCPQAASASLDIIPEQSAITLFLLLRAFASGATALTGVEAVADGVLAFREPKARNAATTLAMMGSISITMFLGISFLAHAFNVHVSHDTAGEYGTVLSQIGRTAFGGGFGFYALQVATTAILVLAANTAYQDFPRLSAILANHRLLPRQFRNRGDRLVFSNGILILAFLAVLLLIFFQAEVTHLIQLYVVGVFTAFTLSQIGMVRRWQRTREPGWQRSALINAIGATATGLVLIVTAAVKFTHGAWMVVTAIPLLVWMMWSIRRHYMWVAEQLRNRGERPMPGPHRVVVPVSHTGVATARAVDFARLLAPADCIAVHVKEPGHEDLVETWSKLYPEVPLTMIDPDGRTVPTLRRYLRQMRKDQPDGFLTVVIPESVRRTGLAALLFRPRGLVLKLSLFFEPGIVVSDLTYQRRRRMPDQDHPRRIDTVVLVSELTAPTLNAVNYARTVDTEARFIHLAIDEDQTARVRQAWDDAGIPEPLELVESPYREITTPVTRLIRRLRHDAPPRTSINVILPEFIVPGWKGQALHNQTSLAIKATLIFEPNVVVTSVTWHLDPEARSQAGWRKFPLVVGGKKP